MYETVDLGRGAKLIALSPEGIARFEETARAVQLRSTVHWGEHCTECAFPTCYADCAFYTPRPDLHCRRFEQGFEPVTADGLDLTRIRFRQWAKLEGQGPAAMHRPDAVARQNRLDRQIGGALDTLPLPGQISAGLTRRWNRRKTAQSLGKPARSKASLIIEAWLETDLSVPFTVTVVPTDKTEQGLFQDGFTLGQGYTRVMVPVSRIAAAIDITRPHLIQIEPIDLVPTPIVFGLVDFAETVDLMPVLPGAQPASEAPAKKAKCIVWDLDNTLWDGTLAEDGIEGLTLRPEAVAAIQALDERGILHAVASKNDAETGLAALSHFGLTEYFLAPQIGWGPKSESIRAIADRIDIGINSLIFIDDQPFERGEVIAAHPAVECLPETAVDALLNHPRLDVPMTPEARRRRHMYREQEMRNTAQQDAKTDYLGFLRGCDLKLTILPLAPERMTRAYELSERTNQLNFAGTRLGRAELDALIEPVGDTVAHLLHCEDRFGDYGIIGLVLLDTATATIKAFMMSCRVQRKLVEQAYFAHLGKDLATQGHDVFTVLYRKTARNGASRTMLEELDFVFEPEESPDAGHYRRQLSQPWANADIVAITDTTCGLALRRSALTGTDA